VWRRSYARESRLPRAAVPLAAASDSLTNVLRPLYRKDILVVVDQHLQEKKGETIKTAELLKAAGCVQLTS